jgi:hypothetical protein
MIYDWVLVLILVSGPLPNANVEVVGEYKTKQECRKAMGTKKNHICLPKDYN